MADERPDQPILNYAPDPEPPVRYPARWVVLFLALPMAALVAALPAEVRGGIGGLTFRTFWYLRTAAILTALVSIFLVPFAGSRTPWYARVNLLFNLPGLALSIFGLFRWLLLNMPT